MGGWVKCSDALSEAMPGGLLYRVESFVVGGKEKDGARESAID